MIKTFVSFIRGRIPIKCVSAVLAVFLTGQEGAAANSWYYGTVTQIITSNADGSFIVSVDNSTIQSTCAWGRVTFDAAEMGADRTKAALSMALAAYTAGKEWGVVIDLPTPGSECKASSTSTQGAGIRG